MNKERRLFYIILMSIVVLLAVAGLLAGAFFISLSQQEPGSYQERIARMFGRGPQAAPTPQPEPAALELAIGTSGRARKFEWKAPTHPAPPGRPPTNQVIEAESGRVTDLRSELPFFFDERCEEYGGPLDLSADGAGINLFLGPGQICMNLQRPEIYLATNQPLSYTIGEDQYDACELDREMYVCMRMGGSDPSLTADWTPGPSPGPSPGTNRTARRADASSAWRTDTLGQNQAAGRNLHFAGLDPQRWFIDAPAYAHVQYDDIVPGVDLLGYADRNRLEYVFVIWPGTAPDDLSFTLDGTRATHLDGFGNLVMSLDCGKLVLRAPAFYHVIDGLPRPVAGRYLFENNRVRFSTGTDGAGQGGFRRPALDSLSYLGGTGHDRVYAVTTDARGHVYVAGETFSPAFLTEHRPARRVRGTSDAFVTKIRIADAQPVYTAFIGGSAVDRAFGVTVDAAGNVYVCGETLSTDFPQVNTIPSVHGGEAWDAFVVKLDPWGNLRPFASRIGGRGDDRAYAIALGPQNKVYVAGATASHDFPRTRPLATTRSRPVGMDAFVARLDIDAGVLDYTALIGGTGNDAAYGLGVDAAGHSYIAGETRSDDFPLVNPLQKRFGGGVADAFVTCIDAGGESVLYSTFFGGDNDDRAHDIGVDLAGNAYVVGETASGDLAVKNALQRRYAGGVWDGFAAKILPSGTGTVYVTYLGGSGDDRAFAVAPDTSGFAHVAGGSTSTNLPVIRAAQPYHSGGTWDGFAARLEPGGELATYFTYVGGSGTDILHCAAVGYDHSAQVAGYTSSTNLVPVNAVQPVSGGMEDALMARLLPPDEPAPELCLVPGGGQPAGPAYDFFLSKYEISNTEFVRFLNDAQVNPGNARGTNMFFDAFGNAWFSPRMEREHHEMFSVDDSRIVYRADFPTGSRYGVTPRLAPQGGSYSNHPVVGVSWYGAVKYCNWLTVDSGRGLNERCYREGTNSFDWAPVTGTYTNWVNGVLTGEDREQWLRFRGYRLPMDNCAIITNRVVEADILVRTADGDVRQRVAITNRVAGDRSYANPFNEYYKASAWTGGTNMPYGFGRSTLDARSANYLDAGLVSRHDTTPVGFYDGSDHSGAFVTRTNDNRYGIHDLSGNVTEWLSDPGLSGVAGFSRDRACYGGSWMFDMARNEQRFFVHPHFTDRFRGFRVVTTYSREMYVVRIPYQICLCGYGTGPGCGVTKEEEQEIEEEAVREPKGLEVEEFPDGEHGVIPSEEEEEEEEEEEPGPIDIPEVSPSDV